MNEMQKNITSQSFLLSSLILVILFMIGLLLQIRIIRISIRTKVTTWKIDTSHSIIMIIYFSFRIFFEKLIDVFPTFHEHCGTWFCYLALFIQIFCGLSMVSNSFIVALYKYLYIVRHNRFRTIGDECVDDVLIWSSLFVQAALSITAIARPSFPRFSSVIRCLGQKIESTQDKIDMSPYLMVKNFFFCGLDDNEKDQVDGIFSYVMNVTNITVCFLTSVIFFVILTNLMEMFLYQKIFAHMKR